MARLIYILLFCMVFMAVAFPCTARTTDEIEVDWALDGSLAGVTGALWLGFELAKSEIAPEKCVWCDTNKMDESITDALSWPTPSYAAKTADATVYGLIPAFAVGTLALSSGLDGRIGNLGADALLLVQTATISSLINQFVKFSVGRPRPFTVRNNHEFYKDRADDNLSFYSGHTNLAFALVVSAGTIAHLRNYDAEPYIWGIGIPLALFAAYSRVAAQKHYFTDVLVGAVIGSTVGFLVPWLHRNTGKTTKKQGELSEDSPTVTVSITHDVFMISGTF